MEREDKSRGKARSKPAPGRKTGYPKKETPADTDRSFDKRKPRPEKSFDTSRPKDSKRPRLEKPAETGRSFDKRKPRPEKSFDTSRPKDSKRPRLEKPSESGRPFDQRNPRREKPAEYSRPSDPIKPRQERPVEGRKEYQDKQDDKRRTYDRPYSNKRGTEPTGRKRPDTGLIRLNKYIADAGICSRREADKIIESGAIRVNGKITTVLGTKVSPDDKVQYGDQTLSREILRYVVLNKPKGFITTLDDPQERKTVMMLVDKACHERIYPVGRLDRNTTGVLLFTNDGKLAKKLTHPKHNIRKVYHVVLDKAFTKADMAKVTLGVELEDGVVNFDAVAYVGNGEDKKQIGVELHSGKNRVVRRVFETLGYDVMKLDRVSFAGITKKDVPRSHWRHLRPEEVNILKRM